MGGGVRGDGFVVPSSSSKSESSSSATDAFCVCGACIGSGLVSWASCVVVGAVVGAVTVAVASFGLSVGMEAMAIAQKD